MSEAWSKLIEDLSHADRDWAALLLLFVVSFIVLEAVSKVIERKRSAVGVSRGQHTVTIDGSATLPVREYISEKLGLAGRPDALIVENGFVIPVERKPLDSKIRDRYVAQILVYMRLVEEFEGKKPPYGYLILGPSARRIRIENSASRQSELDQVLTQMRGALAGAVQVSATPSIPKCKKCGVRESCSAKVVAFSKNASPA